MLGGEGKSPFLNCIDSFQGRHENEDIFNKTDISIFKKFICCLGFKLK